jgi:threonine aldolase
VLGKEQAMFMPTGTLANHLAVRALAGGPSRVIVQNESHLYRPFVGALNG